MYLRFLSTIASFDYLISALYDGFEFNQLTILIIVENHKLSFLKSLFMTKQHNQCNSRENYAFKQ